MKQFTKPLPTKLYLHLSLQSWGEDWTVFTDPCMRDSKSNKEYPFIAEVEVTWPVTLEDVQGQYHNIKLGALYKRAGEAQHALDKINEEIRNMLAIGHDEEEHSKEQVLGDEDIFDDDIPF